MAEPIKKIFVDFDGVLHRYESRTPSRAKSPMGLSSTVNRGETQFNGSQPCCNLGILKSISIHDAAPIQNQEASAQ
jgi:hypothetical protein